MFVTSCSHVSAGLRASRACASRVLLHLSRSAHLTWHLGLDQTIISAHLRGACYVSESLWLTALACLQMLDKIFMSAIVLLTAAWRAISPAPEAGDPRRHAASKHQRDTAPGSITASSVEHGVRQQAGSDAGSSTERSLDGRGAVAVSILGALADIQFCRMRLAAYAALLKAVLAAASEDKEVGCLSHLHWAEYLGGLIWTGWAPVRAATGGLAGGHLTRCGDGHLSVKVICVLDSSSNVHSVCAVGTLLQPEGCRHRPPADRQGRDQAVSAVGAKYAQVWRLDLSE